MTPGGLNSAAAARVEAATATGVWTRNTWVASKTRPAYTATSRPTTKAWLEHLLKDLAQGRPASVADQ